MRGEVSIEMGRMVRDRMAEIVVVKKGT